jgi:hypothetical protein
MSGFDLPDNFILDPEALLRKKGTHASTSSATPPTTKPLIPVPAATNTMAQKSLWCRPVHFVDCQVRIATLTFRPSLNCVTLSSSKMSHLRLSGFVYFLSPLWGRQSSGSTRTRKLSIHGENAPLCSSLNSSLSAKPMRCGEESPTSSRHQWNPSQRRGRGCKSTSKHALTIGWRTGWCSRTSTMG